MNSKGIRKLPTYLKLLTFSMAIVLLVMCFIYFKTMYFFEVVSDSTFAWNNVDRVFVGEFDTFEKNNCSKQTGEQDLNCQCVLLIHGLGDTAYTWQKTLIEAKQNYEKPVHLFALNLPGSLESPKLVDDANYKPNKLAERIAKSFLPLCQSWILVGNSYGGWLSILISQQNPEKIKSMVLTAPAGLKKDYSHILNYFLKPTVDEAKSFYKKTYYSPLDLPDFVFSSVVERSKTLPIVTMLNNVQEDDYLDASLKKNKVKTRLIWGDSDNVILTEWGNEFHSKMNNSTLKIAEKCGHIPQKECFEIFLSELNLVLTEIH